jgi:hypothetical protein
MLPESLPESVRGSVVDPSPGDPASPAVPDEELHALAASTAEARLSSIAAETHLRRVRES